MRIAFVTDVHFGPQAGFEGKLRKLTHLAGALLAGVVKQLNEVEHPDLIVNLGDVIEDETQETDMAAYQRFHQIIADAHAPVLHVAGNHDTINMTPEHLRSLWRHPGELHYSRDHHGVHLAVLRSVETTGVKVRVPEAQLEWLRDDLAQTRLPTVVLIHHPLADMDLRGNRWFERHARLCLVENRASVRDVIRTSARVVAVFNGHAHWHRVDVIDDIPYVTLQSLIENLDDDAPGRAARAYAIADLDGKALTLRVLGEEPSEFSHRVT